MRINKPVGSKDRLVEIFQRVNHVKLNENLMEMGGANLNQDSVLNVAFDQLKTKRIKVDHSNTQINGDETYVEIACTDQQGNTITFTFKVNSSEGDQQGVYNVNNVTLNTFSFDSADGEETVEMAEDGLKRFNQQHANDMYDAIEEYIDVEPEDAGAEEYSDELQEAITLIDAIKKDSQPFGGDFDKMQTGKAYADQKPTNSAVRVSSPLLDKFVQENTVNELDKPAMKLKMQPVLEMDKPIVGMALGGVVENFEDEENPDYGEEVDTQEFDSEENPDELETDTPTVDDMLPVDNEPAPEVSPEKRDKILQAYDALVKRNSGRNPNYSPTTPEVMAELDRMSGVKKPQNTRTIPKGAEDHWMDGINEEEKKEKEKDDNYSPFKQLGKTFKPKSQSKYPKKKKKPQTSVKINEIQEQGKYEDVVFLQGDEAYEPLERLENSGPDAALEYLKQWHYPGEHSDTDTLGHGSEDKTYEKDGYIMSWNTRLGYIGLKYDTSAGGNNINEVEEEEEDNTSNPVDMTQTDPNPALMPSSEEKSQVEIDNPDVYPDGWKEMDGMFMGPNSPGYGQSEPQGDEKLVGGEADGMSGKEFNPDQLAKGLKTEMEHTDDPKVALEIVMDHLTEIPDYYDHLEGMEKEAGVEDDDMTDTLLGFKPHNVGDEPEAGGEENVQVIDASADDNAPEEMSQEEPAEPELPKKENELGESKISQKNLITEELVKTARQAINNRGIVKGMTKKEAIQILIKHNIK